MFFSNPKHPANLAHPFVHAAIMGDVATLLRTQHLYPDTIRHYAFIQAILNNQLPAIQQLKTPALYNIALTQAALRGYLKVVEYLILQVENTEPLETALIVATINQHTDTVYLLQAHYGVERSRPLLQQAQQYPTVEAYFEAQRRSAPISKACHSPSFIVRGKAICP